MFKKDSQIKEKNNVRAINGRVAFSGVELNVHCFEVDGVLIDSGAQALLCEFKPFFSSVDVEKVLITHAHEDHTGGAGYMQEKYGVPVFIHEQSVDKVNEKAKYPLYRQAFWGRRQSFEAQPLGKTFTSRNATWDVIETPGHTKDHLSFLNRETGQLFTGDLFVSPKIKVVLREESMPSRKHSIERVLKYDFDEIFCCHAGYVENGRQALIEKWENLSELEERILSLHKQGYTKKEIHSQIFDRTYPITFFSMGEWDSIHIVNSFIDEQSN